MFGFRQLRSPLGLQRGGPHLHIRPLTQSLGSHPMTLQRDLHDQLRREALANHERLATAVRKLDPEQLVRRPSPTTWSVALVLEHLCVTDERGAKPLATLIHRARPDAGAPLREWKPSFMGKLIAGALAKPKPLGAPRVFRPAETP